jgi:hypothetical protein
MTRIALHARNVLVLSAALLPGLPARAAAGSDPWGAPSLLGTVLLLLLGAAALWAVRRRPVPVARTDRRGTVPPATPATVEEPEEPATITLNLSGDLTLGAELRAYVEKLAADPALGVGLARPDDGSASARAAS